MVSTPSENKEASSYKSFSAKQLRGFQEVETWLKNVGSHLIMCIYLPLGNYVVGVGKTRMT